MFLLGDDIRAENTTRDVQEALWSCGRTESRMGSGVTRIIAIANGRSSYENSEFPCFNE